MMKLRLYGTRGHVTGSDTHRCQARALIWSGEIIVARQKNIVVSGRCTLFGGFGKFCRPQFRAISQFLSTPHSSDLFPSPFARLVVALSIVMLSLVASALAFNGPSAFMTVHQSRSPAISMYSTIQEPVVGSTLRDSREPSGFGKGEITGVIVPTNKKVKGIKSFESKFSMGRVTDSTAGPPCGIAHHQGSGTKPHTTAGRFDGKYANMGNCAGDECQIG